MAGLAAQIRLCASSGNWRFPAADTAGSPVPIASGLNVPKMNTVSHKSDTRATRAAAGEDQKLRPTIEKQPMVWAQ
jgi:hypothetical protein